MNDAIQLAEDADKPVHNPDVGECQKPREWPQYTVTCSKFGEVLVLARCQGPKPSDVHRAIVTHRYSRADRLRPPFLREPPLSHNSYLMRKGKTHEPIKKSTP